MTTDKTDSNEREALVEQIKIRLRRHEAGFATLDEASNVIYSLCEQHFNKEI